MHEHAHRVVPAGDVADGPRQGAAAGQHRVDFLDIPADAVDRPVDVRARQPPRLADLPHQQQGEQITVVVHGVQRGAHPHLAFGQRYVAPSLVVVQGRADGLPGLVRFDHGWSGDG